MLLRPIAIGFGLVLAVLVILARPRHRTASAVLVLLGNFAIIAPWEAWVYLRTGSIVVLSSGGPASIRDGLTFAVKDKGFRDRIWIPGEARQVMQGISERYPELRTVGAISTELVGQFQKHPVGVLELLVLKGARSWYGTDSHRFELLTLLLQGFCLAAVVWSTARAWRCGDGARRVAVGGWTIACYFWVMNIAGASLVRYTVPTMSVLFLILPALLCKPAPTEFLPKAA